MNYIVSAFLQEVIGEVGEKERENKVTRDGEEWAKEKVLWIKLG